MPTKKDPFFLWKQKEPNAKFESRELDVIVLVYIATTILPHICREVLFCSSQSICFHAYRDALSCTKIFYF